MKMMTRTLTALCIMALLMPGLAVAADSCCAGTKVAAGGSGGGMGDMGGMPGMDMSGQAKPQKSNLPGKSMRHGMVEGYGFMYQLLNMTERSALMMGMEGMDMPGMSKSPDVTNHLMLFLYGPDKKPASGTVGFMITGPDGAEQKTMTMAMQGGYGADVIFKAKGRYTIKAKAVIGEKTLNDEFTFELK
jgi:hypothetical protein